MGTRKNFTIPGGISVDSTGNTFFVDDPNNRVGINKINPEFDLDVSGVIKGSSGVITLTSNGTPATTIADGALAVDTLNHLLYFRSGSTWRYLLGPTNSVTLGTDTIGNYVSSVVAGTGVTLTGSAGEGWSPTIAIGQVVNTNSDVTFNTITAGAGYLTASTATSLPLRVRGASSQTANLQEWQNSAGALLSSIGSSGAIIFSSSIGTSFVHENGVVMSNDGSANGIIRPYNATGAIKIRSLSNTVPGLIVFPFSGSQTANLQEWHSSTGTVLASISSSGGLSAATKSFDIVHPTKDNMRLRYGSVEAPEHSVQVRGYNDTDVIELPDYWKGLIDEETITVQLTPVGKSQRLHVRSWDEAVVIVGGSRKKEYFYTVSAERKDVPKLVVEYGD